MNISAPLARLSAIVPAATFAFSLLAVDAMAAKEKFERNKPHVNVGTIGHGDDPNPTELTAPTGGTTSTSQSLGDNDCKPDPSKAGDQSTC